MMGRPDVFTDEVIIDELLGFFGAATETTHNVTKTILTYLCKKPESLYKIRGEFDEMFAQQCKQDFTLSSQSKAEQMKKLVTVDNCFDLDFLNLVICEGLRFQGPGGVSPIVFKQDVTLANKLKIKKGDRVRVLNWALHKHSGEWQRPHEFLPERFDPESPLYLTPSGKKRNSASWVPFSGGKRICFGKTFAESNLKIILTYFTQYFDFEYVDKSLCEGDKYPVAVMFQSKNPPLMLQLTDPTRK